jgi:hypothetical protein
MDISRGLLRLWLVATAIWIVAVLVIQLNDDQALAALTPGIWPAGGMLDLNFWFFNVLIPPVAVFAAGGILLWAARGFGKVFALWLFASSLWITMCVTQIDYICFFGHHPQCASWVAQPFLTSTYVEVLAITFGIPIAVLILGLAFQWIMGGFRPHYSRGR